MERIRKDVYLYCCNEAITKTRNMKTAKEQIQLILNQENDRMFILLEDIENGEISRRNLERRIKEHITMNKILQKLSNENT